MAISTPLLRAQYKTRTNWSKVPGVGRQSKMGEFRFRLPDDWRLETRHSGSIHVVGLDGIPWPCRIHNEGSTLLVSRNRDESGHVYISYPFKKYGEFLICTGTLTERPEKYDLLMELARGTLNRLRNQISVWQEGGLEIPPNVHAKTREAISTLGSAIMGTDFKTRDDLSQVALDLAFDALFELSEAFGTSISRFRVENEEEFSRFWFAHQAPFKDPIEPILDATNFELIEVRPSQLELDAIKNWDGESTGKRLIVGPFLDASPGGLDQPLIQLDDFETRRNQILNQCRSAVPLLPNATSLIHLVSGLNGLGHRHLSYPQQLQLVIDLLHTLEESSSEIPVMISFDFPWAERLASSVGGIHPLQIADTLLRQGLRVALLGLDINLDYWPTGSLIRDTLQWIDLIDVWSQLGIPLVVCLRVPTGEIPNCGENRERLVNEVRSNLTDEERLYLLESVIPAVVARPAVHGLILRQWDEDSDKRYPGAGLVDASGNPKPILARLIGLRERHQF